MGVPPGFSSTSAPAGTAMVPNASGTPEPESGLADVTSRVATSSLSGGSLNSAVSGAGATIVSPMAVPGPAGAATGGLPTALPGPFPTPGPLALPAAGGTATTTVWGSRRGTGGAGAGTVGLR